MPGGSNAEFVILRVGRRLNHVLSSQRYMYRWRSTFGGFAGGCSRLALKFRGATAGLLEAEGIAYVRGMTGLPQRIYEDPFGNLVELNLGWAQQPGG
jgi:hypothetical protein